MGTKGRNFIQCLVYVQIGQQQHIQNVFFFFFFTYHAQVCQGGWQPGISSCFAITSILMTADMVLLDVLLNSQSYGGVCVKDWKKGTI